MEPFMLDFNRYQPVIPLLYLAVIALIAGSLHVLQVPIELITLIVGGGLTRVKRNETIKK
jgi:hypothetical protein